MVCSWPPTPLQGLDGSPPALENNPQNGHGPHRFVHREEQPEWVDLELPRPSAQLVDWLQQRFSVTRWSGAGSVPQLFERDANRSLMPNMQLFELIKGLVRPDDLVHRRVIGPRLR